MDEMNGRVSRLDIACWLMELSISIRVGDVYDVECWDLILALAIYCAMQANEWFSLLGCNATDQNANSVIIFIYI